ncbi:hypothetical protein PGB90_002239 [Kerria lacca]
MKSRKKSVKRKKVNQQVLRQTAPVHLSRYYLKKAFSKIKKVNVKKDKQRHPVIEDYGDNGYKCLNQCLMPSVKLLFPYFLKSVKFSTTGYYLQTIIRKSILNHDWMNTLHLLEILLEYKALNKRYLMYLFRVTFLLIFNLKINTTEIKEFLSVRLGKNDNKSQDKCLESIHTLEKLIEKKRKRKNAN